MSLLEVKGRVGEESELLMVPEMGPQSKLLWTQAGFISKTTHSRLSDHTHLILVLGKIESANPTPSPV